MSTPKQKSPQNKTKKRPVWPIISLLISLLLIVLLPLIDVFSYSSICRNIPFCRTITRSTQEIGWFARIASALFSIYFATLCFSLLKKTHTWVYCGFFTCLSFIVGFLFHDSDKFLLILFSMYFITLCFALFQKTHKWIYFGFFTSLTFIITLAGQILDYITRPDVSVHTHDVLGTAYGDYGLGSSSYDLDESYNYPNRSQNTSSKDTSSEDYSEESKICSSDDFLP